MQVSGLPGAIQSAIGWPQMCLGCNEAVSGGRVVDVSLISTCTHITPPHSLRRTMGNSKRGVSRVAPCRARVDNDEFVYTHPRCTGLGTYLNEESNLVRIMAVTLTRS